MSRSILLFGSSPLKGIPALILILSFFLFANDGKAAVGDTVIVNCTVGEANYLTWLDNLSIKYKIPVVQAGGSVTISPEPNGYPYMQTCEDTIRHTFTYFNSQGNRTGSNVFLFIRKNLFPPVIVSPFPDTIRLSCSETIPDRNSVSFQTCQLAEVTYNEVVTKDSLCSFSSIIVSTWTARDKCNRETSYKLVILIAPLNQSLFLKKAPDISVKCGSSLNPSATGRPILNESCESVSLTYQDSIVGIATNNCQTSYIIFRKWNARGSCATVSTYFQKITISNSSAIKILCPSDREINVFNNSCQAKVKLPYPLTEGKCPSGFIYYKINEGNTLRWGENTAEKEIILPAGFHKITYSIFDCEGEIVTCVWFIKINEFWTPEISCIADKTAVIPINECKASVPLPRPSISADNCNQNFLYQQRHTLDTNYARTIFSDRLLPFSVIFNEVPNFIRDSATISFSFRLNMANAAVRLNIRGERNELIGSIPSNGLGCNITRNISFKIAPQVVQNWIDDGKISFSIEPVGNIPPCDNVDIISNLDNKSFFLAEFSVNRLNPIFYIRGVTNYPNTLFDLAKPVPVVQLNPGISQVYYVITDANGNADTCTFNINTIDDQFPIIECKTVTKKYSPGDLVFPTISVDDILVKITDNCTIKRRELNITRLNCAQTNGDVPVILSIFDEGGNVTTCNSVVKVQKETPKPDYRVNICGGDTLFLFANPPSQAVGNDFKYRWVGPNGFTSTLQNPKIPFSRGIHSGNYTVEVTGTMGCSSTGTVNVFIADIPSRAIIQGGQKFCVGTTINLRSGANPIGPSIKYHWYQGTFPTGVIQAVTSLPTYNFVQNQPSSSSYYLMVENSGCFSEPSVSKNIKVYEQPIAKANFDSTQICVGGTLNLGTNIEGEEISYLWTGPEGFYSTLKIPNPLANIALKNAGNYKLTISRTGCSVSETLVKVSVTEVPSKPSVINNSPICSGDTLFLQSTLFPGEYTWIKPDRSEVKLPTSTLIIPNAKTDLSGDWRLKASHPSCPDVYSDFIPIKVNAFEKPTVALQAQEVCAGSPVRLSVSAPQSNGSYVWKGPLNFQRTGSDIEIDSITLDQRGKYSVRFTTKEGCVGGDETEIFVKQSVIITSFDVLGDPCAAGTSTILLKPNLQPLDNGTYRYFWSGTNGFTARTNQLNLSGLGSAVNGTYQLYVISANSCQSQTASYQIKLGDKPSTPVAPYDRDLGIVGCLNNKFILSTSPFSGIGSVSYHWILPNGKTIQTSGPNLEIPKITFSDEGNYRVFIRNNGCSSDTSLASKITVKPIPILTVSQNSPVCAGSTLKLNAGRFDGAVYKWTGPNFSSFEPNVEIPNIQKSTHEGDYSVIMTLNGCSTDPITIPVVVLPAEVIPTLEPLKDICLNKPTSISLKIPSANYVVGATYIWFANGNPIDSGAQNVSIIQNIITDYIGKSTTFSVTRKGLICSTTPIPIPAITIANVPNEKALVENDFSICQSTSINISATPTELSSGQWRFLRSSDNSIPEIKSVNSPITKVEGLRAGVNYSFIYALSTDVCKQFSDDTLLVTIKPEVEAYAGENILICETSEIKLNAKEVSQGKGIWTQSAAQEAKGIRILEPEKRNSGIGGIQSGNQYLFTWTVTGECGITSDDLEVVISQKSPFAGIDKSVCLKDGKIQLEGEPVNIGSIGRWKSLSTEARFSDIQSPTAFVFGLKGGTYSFIWEVDNGVCGSLSRDTVVLKILNLPTIKRDSFNIDFNTYLKAPLSVKPSSDQRLTFKILSNPFRGEAKISSLGILEYKPNAIFKGNELMLYEVCTSDCGCTTGEIFIEIGNDNSCAIPSIITPNNDGVNDAFAIPCLFNNKFPNNKVTIYNRRGDVIFNSQGPYQNNWTGKYSEVPLPGGTYFYVVDFGNGEKPQTSFLIIQY